jgi:hypothetical protein
MRYNIHLVVLSTFTRGEILHPSGGAQHILPDVRYNIHLVVLSRFTRGEVLHPSGGAHQIYQS